MNRAGDGRARFFVTSGYGLTVLAVLVGGWYRHDLPLREVTWSLLVGPLRLGWVTPWVCLALIAFGLARPRSLLVAFGALALCAYLFVGWLACGLAGMGT